MKATLNIDYEMVQKIVEDHFHAAFSNGPYTHFVAAVDRYSGPKVELYDDASWAKHLEEEVLAAENVKRYQEEQAAKKAGAA